MTAPSLTAQLLVNGPFTRDAAPFRCLSITGPDAGDFLQRLCSQDVLGLAEGEVAPAAFLDSKGKLRHTCLVFRLGVTYWLELQAEQADGLLALLERYHFTEKLTLAALPEAGCRERVAAADSADRAGARAVGAGLVVAHARHGIAFVRAHGDAAVQDEIAVGPVHPVAAEHAQALRMAAGFVRIGVESEANTLALEAALDDHCSSTKGCYTGQEIVARIHTYGHVNRRLCLLQLPMGAAITAPEPLHEVTDELAVGRVMHAVPVAAAALRVGVGYLPKDFQAAGTELALVDGARAVVVDWGA